MRHVAACLVALAVLGGCAAAPVGDTFATGQPVAFDGRVVSVDASPWAYDGNAVVVVRDAAGRDVSVQLPARWNLCKAAPVDLQALGPGDRVQVSAEATDARTVVVCAETTHHLRKLD